MSLPNATLRGQVHRPTAEDASPVLQWPLAPETIWLGPRQVHLWAAAVNEFVDQAPKLEVLLSPAEQAGAEKFRLVEDRNRYVIRRGLARLILSRYLEQLPAAIEFQHGAYGKPEVRRGGVGTPLFFNTSHSGEIAICTITSACPIGVDVERTREIPDIEEIARRFFRPREIKTFMGLPPDSRMQALYACWTRKEAFLKATGEGIAESLAKVEVTMAPEDKPAVVFVSGDRRAHKQWQLHQFFPASGYVGCVAYRNAALALNQWRVGKSAM
jgi:4'-phosphopantetheinyl transferase